MDRNQQTGHLEYRRFTGELRADPAAATLTFDGYASVTDTPYDMHYYTETITRGAFTRTLSESPDVQMLINHEGLPIARTGRNMTLTEDDRGLHVVATLNPADPDVAQLATKMGDGLVDQMSFAFRVTDQKWDDNYENREILAVSLDRGDVSVVNQGASPTTVASLRSLIDTALNDLTEQDRARVLHSWAARQNAVTVPPVDLPVAAPVVVVPVIPSVSLDTYRARAYMLRQRNK